MRVSSIGTHALAFSLSSDDAIFPRTRLATIRSMLTALDPDPFAGPTFPPISMDLGRDRYIVSTLSTKQARSIDPPWSRREHEVWCSVVTR